MNTTYPVIKTEIYRSKGVDDPFGGHYRESYGIHVIEPDDTNNWYIQPFVSYDETLNARFEGDGRVPNSPTYKESGSNLYSPEDWEKKIQELTDEGYTVYNLNQVPEPFQQYVIHHQCPLEWQGPMDQEDMTLWARVRIWVKGEFPC